MLVAETRVSFAFFCSSGIVSAPQLHMVELCLLYTSLELFDVYSGSQIPEGKKSVAYSVWLRSADATLSDKDIDTVNAAIIKNLRCV